MVIGLKGQEDLNNFFKEVTKKNDIFVCLGAGSISLWANDLPNQLSKE